MRNIPKLVALLIMAALILSGCSADRSAALHEESEVRDGTSEDTLATPSDFPASYD